MVEENLFEGELAIVYSFHFIGQPFVSLGCAQPVKTVGLARLSNPNKLIDQYIGLMQLFFGIGNPGVINIKAFF